MNAADTISRERLGQAIRQLVIHYRDEPRAEGVPFSTAVVEAGRRMLGLAASAQDWDRHAWLGGNEGSAAF